MSRDEDDLVSPHDEDMDVGLQTSDRLDLNLDQDCHNPNVAQVTGAQCSLSSKGDSITNGVLKIGTEFESDEHAYSFYSKYARLVGFSVRKDWVNRSKVHGLVVSRKFTCSKEGYRRKDKRDANVKKHRKETRTGCLAHLIITRQPDGKYRVTHFEAEHNHDSINPNNVQTLPFQKELCVTEAAEADLPSNLGAESNSAFELMNRRFEVGESLDYIAMDFDNYLQSERVRDMKRGEAGRLLRYFQRLHFESPTFFHAIQVDIDDKISNIFWADDTMVVDYDHFGDVICLDTTYRTNKDIQPFVQFIGVNHHNQAVTFAAALLFDDTVESLKWLFRTFLEAMSGKKPKVILTDQDAAIVEAIKSVLPETSHRICVWQMCQNALNHLSHALKDTESFSSDFRSCIYDLNDEEDFIHAWEALLDKYSLQQNEWLRWMFREREKWAIVYGMNTFFLDARGCHVAEDLHRNLRSNLSSDQDALQFFKVFERMVDEQRFKELQANDEMTRCMPRLMGNVVLLKHASDMYTPKAFEIFQKEYEKCLNFVVSQCSESSLFLEYKVNTFGRSREYTVTFNPSDDTVICSCRKFENVGFLCGHALKVLDQKNIKVLPSKYILKRWTKDARIGYVRESKEFIAQENPKLVAGSRYKALCRRMLKISARATESEEAFQFASRQLDQMIEAVEKILTIKHEEAHGIASSSTAANVSESGNAEIFLDKRTVEDQDEDNRVAGIEDNDGAVPERHQLKYMKEKSSKKHGFPSALPPAPDTDTFVSSPQQACVSTEALTSNPLLQEVMYHQQNPVISHQDNPNLYQPSNFYSDQHDSSRQTPLLQAMDLDLQHPQPSSFMLYDLRYRASDTSFLGSK
ncbi:protein FAR1-RELATED SEQUENCE 5 isoform X2 [Hevea brasiliensis]|uniref:protein FAR1-RELATED SEQUENCE 5 isoform X2 n=1 Tax=Hevea brasiliensis TaxID=3981 RepID=UPI000B78D220|nr:protein FAR1-RELATED SEQUENCE 5 isoform X2 [Hevea brasiliensis]